MAGRGGAAGARAGGRPGWQQAMLRVRDPERSLRFYRDALGMTLVDRYDFPQWKFSLYFLESRAPGAPEYALEPGSPEAHRYLWGMPGVALELTHNHDSAEEYHPGNAPGDGFGHLAVSVPDVYAACAELEAAGVDFHKKPDEGRMKGLAFALDPDGYWLEIVKRGEPAGGGGEPAAVGPTFRLAQTMLRVRDPKASVAFYRDHFNMTLVRESHYETFSNYFMASLGSPGGPGESGLPSAPDPAGPDARSFLYDELYPRCIPVLELTHNHGTEDDAGFSYANGNEEGRRGFGHTGFLVDDVYTFSGELEAAGVAFHKRPDEGGMKGLAFAKDPDGYLVEIIKRGQAGDF